MKILISPAKKLNFDEEIYPIESSFIEFENAAEKLIKKLKKLKPKAIAELMHLSPALADLNYERYQNWELPFDDSKTKPAVFAFDGEVYSGLSIRSFSKEDLEFAQQNLFILSGLYGVLKPMDEILPYRLEMGTSFAFSSTKKNLYQFWGDEISKRINSSLEKDEIIINLASAEYFKAVNTKKLQNPIITPVFKEFDGNNYKMVMVYAKQARGAMTQYLLKNKIDNIEELKKFNSMNYRFNEALSSNNDLVFTR